MQPPVGRAWGLERRRGGAGSAALTAPQGKRQRGAGNSEDPKRLCPGTRAPGLPGSRGCGRAAHTPRSGGRGRARARGRGRTWAGRRRPLAGPGEAAGAGCPKRLREGTTRAALTAPAGSWSLLAGRSRRPRRRPWSVLGRMPGNRNAHRTPRSVAPSPPATGAVHEDRRRGQGSARSRQQPGGPQSLSRGVHSATQVPPRPPPPPA